MDVIREFPEDIRTRLSQVAEQMGVGEDDLLLSFVGDALDDCEKSDRRVTVSEPPSLFPDDEVLEATPVIEPKNSLPFSFIDLFAGVGGLRLGLEAVGGRCVFSCEKDKYAQKTYVSWFGEDPTGDVTELSRKGMIPDHDLLAAGFPCQPFSIAGVSKKNSLGRAHGFKDRTQGTLFFHLAEIIDRMQPPTLLLENVKNLRSHDKGQTWKTIQGTLEELGYVVFDKVIDAADYVPQHRERVFIVGFRRDIFGNTPAFGFPAVPEATRPKLRDILESRPDEKYTLSDKLWAYLQDYAEKHRRRGNGFGCSIAKLNGTTRTLSARYHKDGSEILIAQRNRNPRRLTPQEAGRLMGFPEALVSRKAQVVSDTQAYRQFGNAVVPAVVTAVAIHIVSVMREAVVSRSGNGCVLKTKKRRRRRLDKVADELSRRKPK
ncbi:MAG: DNA (cytosine-5-)-methyltransferase [Fuerstiella sp.]|jgi:DNA (cytosine-5)-methyltransferase 1|nr:DNA (cytosine-5-)-methyltransferase [Fuerstiella sp.]